MALPVGKILNDEKASTATWTDIPVGKYEGIVNDAEVKQTSPEAKKFPNTDYINWEFEVEVEDKTRKCWLVSMLTPESAGYLRQTLIAMGYTEEDLDDPDFEVDLNECIGRKVTVVIGRAKDRDGNPTTAVKKLLPAGEAASSPF